MRLEQQIALLAPFQRLFHYWHVLHLPVALLMFLALAVHVTLAVLFGYAWPF
jgi:membrane-associated PAP2 superfamily phosphatase